MQIGVSILPRFAATFWRAGSFEKLKSQITEQADALKACDYQHQTKQQGKHPVVQVFQIFSIRMNQNMEITARTAAM